MGTFGLPSRRAHDAVRASPSARGRSSQVRLRRRPVPSLQPPTPSRSAVDFGSEEKRRDSGDHRDRLHTDGRESAHRVRGCRAHVRFRVRSFAPLRLPPPESGGLSERVLRHRPRCAIRRRLEGRGPLPSARQRDIPKYTRANAHDEDAPTRPHSLFNLGGGGQRKTTPLTPACR